MQVHGYSVELHPLTDGGWQALVPALLGCMSDGKTMIEAIANVAGLLRAGVPLAPVMAFWLSSPALFVVTAGTLGLGFAVAKPVAALTIGLAGGVATHWLQARGALRSPLKSTAGARRWRSPPTATAEHARHSGPSGERRRDANCSSETGS